MDYTQTLLHYILPQPHYVLQMNSQTWEGEEGEEGEKGGGGGGGNLVKEMKVVGEDEGMFSFADYLRVCACLTGFS